MIVIRADDVAGLEAPPPHRRTLKVLLSPAVHKVSSGLGMGVVILSPGETSSPHSHESEQEVWYVISGHGKFRVGNEEAEVGADTVVISPPGTTHQIVNIGKSDLKALFLFSPAGPETQYFP